MTDQKQSLNEGEVSMPRNIKNYCYCSKLIHNPTKASHETINKVSKINKFNKVNPPLSHLPYDPFLIPYIPPPHSNSTHTNSKLANLAFTLALKELI